MTTEERIAEVREDNGCFLSNKEMTEIFDLEKVMTERREEDSLIDKASIVKFFSPTLGAKEVEEVLTLEGE